MRTRMLTPGFKLFFGLFAFLFLGAMLFGVSSELQTANTTVSSNLDANGQIDTITGPLTLGWKGGVGNHLGYAILLTGAAAAAFLAFVLIAFRDADPDAAAQSVQLDSVPLTKAPAGVNYAPIIAAFALAVIALGWIVNTNLLYAGIVLLVATMAVWTVRAWAERATGDDEVNFQIYRRIIDPVRVPALALLAIAFVVGGISRLVLAAPDKTTSSVIFGGAALLFFAGIIVIYLVPHIAKTLAIVFLVIGAVLVLGAGIYGIAKGERPPEPEKTTQEGGLAPSGVGALS
jgi:hypothetical protein